MLGILCNGTNFFRVGEQKLVSQWESGFQGRGAEEAHKES